MKNMLKKTAEGFEVEEKKGKPIRKAAKVGGKASVTAAAKSPLLAQQNAGRKERQAWVMSLGKAK